MDKPEQAADRANAATTPPLLAFLDDCHARYAADHSGAVADYIPELKKADPSHFGISLVTLDGHVYEVGDSRTAFTIQSVSKAFVFALALELAGARRVEATVGVEPSGDAFNSIRLSSNNRPFNAMVNAGAIACSGLIEEAKGADAFNYIRAQLARFAGRELGFDEAVYASESATGNRNRAIAFLLKNYDVIAGDVDAVLDVYFRQCSVLVTARDLAVMSATLANRGVNPVTGEHVVSPYVVSRTLSIMTIAGMYDYAGEWTYRVGLPAKSGVGGGILATLPSQFGMGTFSPLLDIHGNSVRGIKVCEAVSENFDLHILNRSNDIRTAIVANYTLKGISSRRDRPPHEERLLQLYHDGIRVIELTGALDFAGTDYISRQVEANPRPQYLVLDFRRAAAATRAATRLMAQIFRNATAAGTTVITTGFHAGSIIRRALHEHLNRSVALHDFHLLDEGIEWAEDQIVLRHGDAGDLEPAAALAEQGLLQDLTTEEIGAIAAIGTRLELPAGHRIIEADRPASSLFLLLGGSVSVKLPSGVRLTTLSPGMAFGEMALLHQQRSADVWSDTAVTCLEVPLAAFDALRLQRPRIGETVMRNLARLLARRLVVANNKLEVLSES
jgi:glutaminase